MLGAALLTALTGCVGYVESPRAGMYVAPPVVETDAYMQDDYVYYPNYQIYYSNRRHQYAYQDGPNWVYRQSPRGVSIHRLQATPSVRMDFQDSPAQHHQTVLQQYPKNWSPARSQPGHQEDRNDDRRDNRGR